jgi:hypothetical protein
MHQHPCVIYAFLAQKFTRFPSAASYATGC